MSYGISWTATANRTPQGLPEKVATASVEFIYETLADNPARVGKPLRFELEGLHAARRGDYRVIYQIDPADQTVTILAVQHRAAVYRKR